MFIIICCGCGCGGGNCGGCCGCGGDAGVYTGALAESLAVLHESAGLCSFFFGASSVLASPAASPALGTKGGSVCRAGLGQNKQGDV